MALTDEFLDQTVRTPAMINGVTSYYLPTQMTALKAVSPTNSVYAFTHNFMLPSGTQTLLFRKGVAYSLSATVKTALLALSAPMVLQ